MRPLPVVPLRLSVAPLPLPHPLNTMNMNNQIVPHTNDRTVRSILSNVVCPGILLLRCESTSFYFVKAKNGTF